MINDPLRRRNKRAFSCVTAADIDRAIDACFATEPCPTPTAAVVRFVEGYIEPVIETKHQGWICPGDRERLRSRIRAAINRQVESRRLVKLVCCRKPGRGRRRFVAYARPGYVFTDHLPGLTRIYTPNIDPKQGGIDLRVLG